MSEPITLVRTADANARVWLIKKRSLYYRPNRSGYTGDTRDAGRYTRAEADREASVEPWHMSVEHEPPDTKRERMADLEKMIWRLTRKLERLDGESLATQDARRLVNFGEVGLEPVEIVEGADGR
jgi:hypothetical protein